ncbi:hypothetical protein HaLaN_26876, partial [Haematococcus lacustris]
MNCSPLKVLHDLEQALQAGSALQSRTNVTTALYTSFSSLSSPCSSGVMYGSGTVTPAAGLTAFSRIAESAASQLRKSNNQLFEG